ncbi:MAG: type I methionyl aminopeptidase [Candidatus Sericytochromatia bacterium]|nr:type I methionyl aminopeptidase [Candidatus Sericytochromatia bacterium]
MSVLKKASEFEAMRKAGLLVALAHEAIAEAVRPGISSKDLDVIAEAVIVKGGGRPAFKGYHGFPATICASYNEEVVHGIPSRRKLEEGDIISVDIGAIFDGYYGDSAWTYGVGKLSPEVAKLLEVTEASLYSGLAQARAGHRIGRVGGAVQDVVEVAGFSVVRDFVGHGIGPNLHESPQIPNYRTHDEGPVLQLGEALAIEPMVNIGGHEVRVKKNGWTVVTTDGSWSAHFEHTVIVTEGEPEITTRRSGVLAL